ncbi:hypothetical protein [Fredinandcohnia sp. 179-A 10B2 NHS]|uniref:hypothetical protein n=1 Tax=Fredinandcohnia sp. 179-A 10B2 NHS TaxID=3235176 RepID=UPI0039A24CEC
MGYQFKIKIFALMIACVLFIFTFSHVGASTYRTYFSGELFTEGTMIGPVDVSGLTKDEAKNLLRAKITEWNTVGNITIINGDNQEVLTKDELFVFPIDQIVQAASNGTVNVFPSVINKQRLEMAVQTLAKKNLDDFKHEELINVLTEKAGRLDPEPLEINLVSYIIVDETQVISKATISNIKDETEVNKWVKDVGVIEIGPAQSFSLSDFVAQTNGLAFTDEALSIIATGIYETILPTNFKIIERHISDELPAYAKLGYEAKIDGNKDLIFYNINPFQYKLTFALTGEGLQLELIGAKLPNEYEIILGEKEVYKPKTIKQYSSLVKYGKSEVKEKGKDGVLVTVSRLVKQSNKELDKVKLAEDYYKPIHRVEVHGLFDPEELIADIIDELQDQNDTPTIDEDEESELENDGSLWDKENTEK